MDKKILSNTYEKGLFPALPAYSETITYQQAADNLLLGIKSL